MRTIDVIVVGGGPSGLCATKMLLEAGQTVCLIDRNLELGGQLIKQTHKFFGSKSQYAKIRGFDIAQILIEQIKGHPNLTIMTNTTVVGLYENHIVTLLTNKNYLRYQAKAVVIATGASEKTLAFENNDLPGIYGAGAVQTLMNVYGVLPGQNVVMVGSGNIGLIVSYQLMQAGVKVKMLLEASSNIGGYKVHASKIKRHGVDIRTNTTVKKAIGTNKLEAIEIVKLDQNWEQIPGSEEKVELDCLCIAVGLSPMHQLLSMVNAKTVFVNELGGFVPVLDEHHMTSIKGLFACGDVIGIEEASSAMMEGYLVGLSTSNYLNQPHKDYQKLKEHYHQQLTLLREGPFGEKTRLGLKKVKAGEQYA
jgi:sarcosine oxidase, subunit alpha